MIKVDKKEDFKQKFQKKGIQILFIFKRYNK